MELEGATQLVFGRTFEGWSGSDRTYFEVNQEYTHVTGIHWRSEQRAYCRFDENGDLEQAVSVTARSDNVKGCAVRLLRVGALGGIPGSDQLHPRPQV
jgi:hypothetical protein